jgi:hypothetical protein
MTNTNTNTNNRAANRNAAKLWAVMDWLTARGLENGRAYRTNPGIAFRGKYRSIIERVATEFDRRPIEERNPIYQAYYGRNRRSR